MPENLFTWAQLGTLGGASFITFLIVAYTKRVLDKLRKFDTDLYAVAIASVVLFASAVATGSTISWQLVALCIFNGFLVAAAAGKLNDKAVNSQYKGAIPNATLSVQGESGNITNVSKPK